MITWLFSWSTKKGAANEGAADEVADVSRIQLAFKYLVGCSKRADKHCVFLHKPCVESREDCWDKKAVDAHK